MKERPILFSAPMVRAILDGRKTVTRRLVKPNPHKVDGGVPFGDAPAWAHAEPGSAVMRCPYGVRGDRLYLRETWAAPHAYDHLPPRLIPQDARIHYAATEDRGGLLWRPSIHMPRWASRILLEITAARVERLQDISEADARAEGAPAYRLPAHPVFDDRPHVLGYAQLWDSINGAGSWDANPWVWVIEFKRTAAIGAPQPGEPT